MLNMNRSEPSESRVDAISYMLTGWKKSSGLVRKRYSSMSAMKSQMRKVFSLWRWTRVVDLREGPAGDDVHLVAEARQLAAQVVGEHALAARRRVPLVDDERYPHGAPPASTSVRRRRRSSAGRNCPASPMRVRTCESSAALASRKLLPGGDSRLPHAAVAGAQPEEPVGRLERVAEASGVDVEAVRPEKARHLAATVDAHVLAGRHALDRRRARQTSHSDERVGDADGDGAAGPQDAGELGQEQRVVGDVLEDLRADDAVEGAVGEGKTQGVAARATLPRARSLPSHAEAERPGT